MDKEKLIEKDIKSIENRVRHAFNQGYEVGLKHGKALEQEPCDDAISRQAVDDLFQQAIESKSANLAEYWKKLIWIREHIKDLPPVNPQEPKWDRLYSWLNDMRLGIAPDETVADIDERNERMAQADMLDEIMEWIEKAVWEDANKAIEQDTVPFDFELYQAGLMDAPEGMIEVLDAIKTEVIARDRNVKTVRSDGRCLFTAEEILEIIDKYKAESEDA